jgi:ribosomal protein L22
LTPANQRIKERRLSSLRRKLIIALINNDKTDEAQKTLREFRKRAGSVPFSI